MDKSKMVTAGLQPLQADVYILLLEKGALVPPEITARLKITRSNAYKILDKLVELGLANKMKINKKLTYQPSNPMALSNMVMESRNQVVAQEDAVKSLLDNLLKRYYEKTEQPTAQTVTGREAVLNAYHQQINLRKPVYFIRSQADVSSMGFDTMSSIRVAPAHYGQQRFGITPDVRRGPANPSGDIRSNLKRTWVKREDYTAPVEWSVSGSMLIIVLFGQEPHAITIVNPVVAEAFRQLWHILDSTLRAMPYYKTLPRTDKVQPKTSAN